MHQRVKLSFLWSRRMQRLEQRRGAHMDELESGHVSFSEQEGATHWSRVEE
jgi:hypothetical protein